MVNLSGLFFWMLERRLGPTDSRRFLNELVSLILKWKSNINLSDSLLPDWLGIFTYSGPANSRPVFVNGGSSLTRSGENCGILGGCEGLLFISTLHTCILSTLSTDCRARNIYNSPLEYTWFLMPALCTVLCLSWITVVDMYTNASVVKVYRLLADSWWDECWTLPSHVMIPCSSKYKHNWVTCFGNFFQPIKCCNSSANSPQNVSKSLAPSTKFDSLKAFLHCNLAKANQADLVPLVQISKGWIRTFSYYPYVL